MLTLHIGLQVGKQCEYRVDARLLQGKFEFFITYIRDAATALEFALKTRGPVRRLQNHGAG